MRLGVLRILLMVLALGPHLQPPGFCFCSLVVNSVCSLEVSVGLSPANYSGKPKACRCCRISDVGEKVGNEPCDQRQTEDTQTNPNGLPTCPYSILAELDAFEPNCLAALPFIEFCHWKIAESLGCEVPSGTEPFPLPLKHDSGRMLCLVHGILLI